MLIMKLKVEQNVVGEFKYSINELKKFGISIDAMANAKYWQTVVDIIAQAIFKSYTDIDSIFAYDSKYEDLAHMTEIFNSDAVKDVVEEEHYPAIYDWDYEPTEEELYGEPLECEEF